jgi:hypothetical protein
MDPVILVGDTGRFYLIEQHCTKWHCVMSTPLTTTSASAVAYMLMGVEAV